MQAQAALSQPWSDNLSEDERRQTNLERLASYRSANQIFLAIVSEIQAADDPVDFLGDSVHLSQIWQAQRWLRNVTNRELGQWEAMSMQTSVLGNERSAVTVRGGGTRFGIAEAQERLIASAALQADDAHPYAEPIFWSAFTITGW